MVLCVIFFAQMMTAQDKFKEEYLPKQGDFGIGFDALPVFRYMGNAFNGYGTDGNFNNMDLWGGTPAVPAKNGMIKPAVSIMGKYMLTDHVALRANVGIIVNNRKRADYVTDDEAVVIDPLSEEKVVDWYKSKQNGVNISLGSEYRRGYKRVQGIFGGSVLFASQKERMVANWGNEMTVVNQMPSYSDIMAEAGLINGNRRFLEKKNSTQHFLGLTGHVGIEYFFTKKMALGAEVNLTLYKQFGSQSFNKYEEYIVANNTVEERTKLLAPGDSGFYFGTDNLGGSLYLMFYF